MDRRSAWHLRLLVPGDAAATSRNIMASEWLFRTGTVSHLISQVIVVFLVLALYRLLEPVNKDHAVLAVVLAVLGIPIAFLSEVNHLAALRLLGSAGDGAFTATQLHAQAMLLLDMRRSGVLVAQIFWGLWLLPLGFLVFRSGFLPKLLGILLAIGGGAISLIRAHSSCFRGSRRSASSRSWESWPFRCGS